MVNVNDDLVEKLMDYLRIKNNSAEDEITDLAQAALYHLEIAGVYVYDIDDPLVIQAVKLYCKAHFGYDEEISRFDRAYSALRDSMALSGDYPEESAETDGGD